MSRQPVQIRPLDGGDLAAYRALRLRALRDRPDAFSADVTEEEAMGDDAMAARLAPPPPGLIFGAFAAEQLVGMAGFIANGRPKTRHKAMLVAVYVAPEARDGGVGRRLVERVIAHARAHRVILQCTVTAHNLTARNLYRRLGFLPYGLERDAICVDGRCFDEELLALDLRSGQE
ncbi:MAG: GNAT family N-acetyltransferase [Rhizobiaceae bacterium]|nr:GNAT family N-acetyltransferase [Rhizobiaceae bacterium]